MWLGTWTVVNSIHKELLIRSARGGDVSKADLLFRIRPRVIFIDCSLEAYLGVEVASVSRSR